MTEIAIVELKLCPFCGEQSACTQYVRDGRRVYCRSCGASACSAFHGPNDDTEQRAIAAWNTRAPDPALKECVEALEAVRALAYDDHWGNAKVDCQIIDLIDATLAAMTKGEE